jgi:Kef-type K+ transport system membrane component KefB
MTQFSVDAQNPLLILGLVLIFGAAGGWCARRIHIPAITGNILAGAALGLTLLSGTDAAQILQPLSTFAFCLIAVAAGGHFSYRRLHNALRRVLTIAGCEALGAFMLVYLALTTFGADWKIALILACLAVETAPATTVAIIRENHAKGPFVKTLLASVSVDSIVCILLFAFVHSSLAQYFDSGGETITVASGVRQTLWILAGSGVLAVALGAVSEALFTRKGLHDFSTMVVVILGLAGVSHLMGLSPLLASLFYGAYLGNSSAESERQLRAFEPIEPLLYTAFFTLAGVALHVSTLLDAGLLCLAYIAARSIGKGAGAYIGGVLSGSSPRIKRNLPLGFVPHAGLALALVVVLEGDSRIPEDFRETVGTIVLAAVAINEIVGPLCTRAALRGAREAGLDRRRLVEFLQEEYIATDLRAADKEDALRQLAAFYARVHRLNVAQQRHVFETILEREREHSTAIGHGAALPHGRVDEGATIQGVLGIFPEGVDFDAPDGAPVRLVALIVTPHEHEKMHLEVLAALTTMIYDDRVRLRLIAAVNANDAWEIIEDEESRGYNYFLEDDGVTPSKGD